jgi:hypothetical protein
MAAAQDKSGNSPIDYRVDDSRERTLTHTFTGTAVSASLLVKGDYSVSIRGITTATIQLQRAVDGVNFSVVTADTADAGYNDKETSPEQVLYRFECTAHTTGTIVCQLTVGRKK